MQIFTIGFTKRSAKDFFEVLREHKIKRLLDIRLNNTSQLAGFTKKDDFAYFLKEICDIDYVHEPLLAPTPELFEQVKKKKGDWEVFRESFTELLAERKVESVLTKDSFAVPTVLLCSEPKAEQCHRSLITAYLADQWGDLQVTNL